MICLTKIPTTNKKRLLETSGQINSKISPFRMLDGSFFWKSCSSPKSLTPPLNSLFPQPRKRQLQGAQPSSGAELTVCEGWMQQQGQD